MALKRDNWSTRQKQVIRRRYIRTWLPRFRADKAELKNCAQRMRALGLYAGNVSHGDVFRSILQYVAQIGGHRNLYAMFKAESSSLEAWGVKRW